MENFNDITCSKVETILKEHLERNSDLLDPSKDSEIRELYNKEIDRVSL
jgi:hypothetical protein